MKNKKLFLIRIEVEAKSIKEAISTKGKIISIEEMSEKKPMGFETKNKNGK